MQTYLSPLSQGYGLCREDGVILIPEAGGSIPSYNTQVKVRCINYNYLGFPSSGMTNPNEFGIAQYIWQYQVISKCMCVCVYVPKNVQK